MGEPRIFAPVDTLPDKKPWERLDGEPARWHMRFKRYLALGYRRSVNAVFEAERQEKAGKGRNKAGEHWYGAARRWQWEARAEAWDSAQDVAKAALMRQIATRSPFVSRPFRIAELNELATSLMRHIEPGQEPAVYLAISRELRALMLDIQAEVDAWGLVPDSESDAAALDAFNAKSTRLADYEEERWLDKEAELDALMVKAEFIRESAERARALQKALGEQSVVQ